MSELEQFGCPWFQRFSTASFAADCVARYIGNKLGFASPDFERCHVGRSGFTLPFSTQTIPDLSPSEDKRLIGALLNKIAHRGRPTRCSVEVERAALQAAADAGALRFAEDFGAGDCWFSLMPRLNNLTALLRASHIPELLVCDEDCGLLLQLYAGLCTEPERFFFERLAAMLPDPRLALSVVPQRQVDSLVASADAVRAPTGRVDFAIEVPSFRGPDILRLVIEIDDATHAGTQAQQDADFDVLLKASGWDVLRFHVSQREHWDRGLQAVVAQLTRAIPSSVLENSKALRSLPPAQARAVQNLILLPLAEGRLTALMAEYIYQGGDADLPVADPQQIGLGPAIEAVAQTIKALCRLHDISGVPMPIPAPVDFSGSTLAYFGWPSAGAWEAHQMPSGWVTTPRPVKPDYIEPLLPAKPRRITPDTPERTAEIRVSLNHLLRNVFGKLEFREGQVEIIERALSLRPVVGLLPTAAGKSLCYQLASFTQPGFTLVIDPLRSLMLDQQENLQTLGIGRSLAIMSGMEATPMEDRGFRVGSYQSIDKGHQLFVFIAPERLQMPDFRQHVRTFAANVPIPYVVVDEAHCVSEWGHDFRPSYLNVGRLPRSYCVHDGFIPSLMALTGTASRNVIIDIMRELEIEDQDSVVEPKSFDRKELHYEIYQVSTADRIPELAGKLRSALTSFGWRPNQPTPPPSGLIFSFFVNGTMGVSMLAEVLTGHLDLPIEVFSGKQPLGNGDDRLAWEQRKLTVQRRFKRNEVPILVCTQAFGMGIDKPDIRFIIHAMLPRSLEEFYQQVGRAGRDRKPARCILIFSDDQPTLADEILDTENTSLEEISDKAGEAPRYEQGDAIRNTWFLTNSFLGRDVEKRVLRVVIDSHVAPNLPRNFGDKIIAEVRFNALPDGLMGNSKKSDYTAKDTALEKTLYRLLLVEGIGDYMKDHSKRLFVVELVRRDASHVYDGLLRYLRRYSTEGEIAEYMPTSRADKFEDAAYECGSALIDYIYATVEKRRRRAIGQMLQVARDAAQSGNERFREQLLSYLEESEFTKPVIALASRMNPHEWFELLSQVTGNDGITKMLGACRRQLEETPSHPGLLMLAGICRTASVRFQQGPQDVRTAFSILRRIMPDEQARLAVAMQVFQNAERLIPSRLDLLLDAVLQGDPSPAALRHCYTEAQSGSQTHHTAIMLLAQSVLKTLAE